MSHVDERITKIRICHSLVKQGVSPEKIPDEVGVHRATVYRWLKGIKLYGIQEFVRRYASAKKGRRRSNKTNPLLKAHVFKIRKGKRNCCGEKIQYFLQKDYGEHLSISTVYRILGEKYQLRSKWKKNMKRGKPFMKATKPREIVQTDTVDFGDVYAFTSIDIFTREPAVVLKDSLTARAGAEALDEQLSYFGSIEKIQRDGGSEFKAEWDALARQRIPHVRTAKPYRKNEQAFIERFNGILRKECLGYGPYKPSQIPELQKRLNDFLDYYLNERPHLSLNMQTPKAFAMSHLT